MTRREFILKWLLYALALTPVLLVQLYLLPRFPLFGTVPALLPVAAAVVAVLEGPVGGAGFGLFVGILSDAMLPGLPGSMTFALALLGAVAGLAARYGISQELAGCMICSAGMLLTVEVVRVVFWLMRGKAALLPLLAVTGQEFFWSMVCAPLIYLIFRWVWHRVPKPGVL